MMNVNVATDQDVVVEKISKFRNIVWPIYRHEYKKVFLMFSTFFLIALIYNLLRCLKLSLIMSAEGSGAKVLPFLKIGFVLPGAILFTFFFTQVYNRFNREHAFHILVGLFVSFMAIFLFILYPNKEFFAWDGFADYLQNSGYIPPGYSGLIVAIRYWYFSLFFVIGEVWSTAILATAFWGYVNEVTEVHEAKRFYAIFALGTNSSGILSGKLAQLLKINTYSSVIPYGVDPWGQTVFLQLSSIIFLCFGLMGLFYVLNGYLERRGDTRLHSVSKGSSAEGEVKEKLSIIESLKYLAKSKYMLYLTGIVISYNLVYNLSDVLWTDETNRAFAHNINDFHTYINQVTFYTGIFAVLIGVLVSSNLIRWCGWRPAALVTPLIWFITCLAIFYLTNLHSFRMTAVFYNLSANPGNLLLLISSIQICLGRACKYSIFDETKEIAFIPLSKIEQRKGKAVIDGIGSRFGKALGAVFYLVLLYFLGSLDAAKPIITTVVLVLICFWIFAVYGLGRMVVETIDHEKKLQ